MNPNTAPIFLLCGPSGVGKDTVADIILDFVPGAMKIAQSDAMKEFAEAAFRLTKKQLHDPKEKEKLFKRPAVKLSAALWEPGARLFNRLGLERLSDGYLTREWRALEAWAHALPPKTTPRHILQTLGTEWGRKIDPDLWAKETWRRAYKLLTDGVPLVVITDGRFRNEVLYGHYQRGHVVRILRPERPTLKGKQAKHSSETEIEKVPGWWFTSELLNPGDGRLGHLRRVVASGLAPFLQQVVP